MRYLLFAEHAIIMLSIDMDYKFGGSGLQSFRQSLNTLYRDNSLQFYRCKTNVVSECDVRYIVK